MQSNHLPKHVLIIPDGNRRWANQQNLPRSEGHIEGMKRFREISRAAREMGISHFTFWAASKKNLKERKDHEILILILLLRQELERPNTLKDFLENQTRFRVLGEWYEILHSHHFLHLRDLRHLIQSIQERTQSLDRHFLTILFGYSGASELDEAERKICRQPPGHIKPGIFRRMLETHELPPVDLVIRTGTERPNWTHISDGILNPWFTPDSQIYSPQILWPDFTAKMFRQTIVDYSKTPRRFGA